MTTGSRVVDALSPTTPDIGAVARSMLGVLAMVAVALAVDSGAAALWVAGAAAIAGAIGLQDSPSGRVPLVIVVSVQMSAAVFLGALAAPHAVMFIAVVGGLVPRRRDAVGARQQRRVWSPPRRRPCWWWRRRYRSRRRP